MLVCEIVIGFIEPLTSDFACKGKGDCFIGKINSSEQKISLNTTDIQGDTELSDFFACLRFSLFYK